MICFSISAPFPWGTQGRSGYCSQGERLHSGRDPKDSQGGTGKAEDAKLPGAGIIPKPCPRNGAAKEKTTWIREASSTFRIGTARNAFNSSTGNQYTYELIDRVSDGGGAVYDVIRERPQTCACVTLNGVRISGFEGTFRFTDSESLLSCLKRSVDKDDCDRIWSGKGPKSVHRLDVSNAVNDKRKTGCPVCEIEDTATKRQPTFIDELLTVSSEDAAASYRVCEMVFLFGDIVESEEVGSNRNCRRC
jgi:hypothetical protein